MKNVLIVDDERPFLLSLTEGLKAHSSQFNVLLAENGNKAVKVLESTPVDLVVTDLRMPEMDGFELLAYMSVHYPITPVIVITAFGTPEIEEQLLGTGTIHYLEKPLQFDELTQGIIKGLESDSRGGFVNGISIASFLQLIEIEQKTCLLAVISVEGNETGFFYFDKGILYDAACGDLRAEEAALKIISWENVRISFKILPKKKIRKRIEKGLMALIMEGMRCKDESEATGEWGEEGKEVISEEEITGGISKKETEEKPIIKTEKDVGERRQKKMELDNAVFEPLKKISGFVGTEIYSGTGDVLLADIPESINTDEVGGLAIELYKNARSIAKQMGMGTADLVELRTESHYFLHSCIVPGKGALGVLMLKDGNVGLMRHTMRKISESLIPHF